MHLRSLFLALAAALLMLPSSASADVIRFKDGTQLTGTIIERTDSKVVIQFPFGVMTFAPEDIAAVEGAAASGFSSPDGSPQPKETGPRILNAGPTVEHLPASDAMRAVVAIRTVSDRGAKQTASGTIIAPNGTIVTSFHIVSNARKVLVALFKRGDKKATVYEADVLHLNPYYDIAVLSIRANTPEFFPLARDAEARVGNAVRTVGNPLEAEAKFSEGRIRGLRTNQDLTLPFVELPGRSMEEREFRGITWIQTDASINAGNTGGPLLNERNELVGINTFGFLPRGNTGFSVALHVKHVRKLLSGYLRKPSPAAES